jgi:hypothetical protein
MGTSSHCSSSGNELDIKPVDGAGDVPGDAAAGEGDVAGAAGAGGDVGEVAELVAGTGALGSRGDAAGAGVTGDAAGGDGPSPIVYPAVGEGEVDGDVAVGDPAVGDAAVEG